MKKATGTCILKQEKGHWPHGQSPLRIMVKKNVSYTRKSMSRQMAHFTVPSSTVVVPNSCMNM